MASPNPSSTSTGVSDLQPPTQFSRLTATSKSSKTKPTVLSEEIQKLDFLNCLSCAQSHHIDFIGITWQEALGRVGKGGEGEIYQSAVSVDAEFAFKRSVPLEGKGPKEVFQELYSEISVLSCRDIRQHPNIINLEGICWEIKKQRKFPGFGPEKESVWPVLIFKKAPHGDLEKFMRSKVGMSLDMGDRMQICAEIGSAITFMHASNIIHGDIKPKNTLVFKKTTPGFTPKVTDFGYSTIAVGKAEITLAQSIPWDAPEYQHRRFTLAEAKKLDVFSFGALCFWVIFREKLEDVGEKILPKVDSFWSRSVGHIWPMGGFLRQGNINMPDIEALVKLRQERTMEKFALECVEADSSLSENQKQHLNRVFQSTLAFETKNRLADLGEIVCLLGQDINLDIHSVPEMLSVPQPNFQVAKSLQSLCLADYRVREHIFSCLKKHYDDGDVSVGRKLDTAFQIAFCTRMGFGTSKDEEASMEWLKKSGYSLHDLQHEIDSTKPDTEIFNFRFRQLSDDGIITPINYALEYQESKDLVPIEERLKNEIKNMEEVLGKTHRAIINLKHTHANILRYMGDVGDLVHLLQGVVDDLTADPQHGPESYDTLIHKGDLGTAQIISGWIEKGGINLLQSYEGLKRIRGDNHMATLLFTMNLAGYNYNAGQVREGIDLSRSALSGFVEVLGDLHPHTMGVKSQFQQQLFAQGKFEEAELVQRELLKDHMAALGPKDPRTIACSESLISLLAQSGQFEEAQKEIARNLEMLAVKEPENHPHILMARDASAEIHLEQGNYKDAADEFLNLQLNLQRSVPSWPPPQDLIPKDTLVPPDAFPNHPKLISLHIRRATALQAQARLDQIAGHHKDASDGFKEARISKKKALADLNKVFGKYDKPNIDTRGGLDDSALHTAMIMGYCPTLELLVGVGAFNERQGLHYKEAISVARDEKFVNIVAILEEHQLLCGGVQNGNIFEDPKDLQSFITGSWSGSYLRMDGGPRVDMKGKMDFSLHCKADAERPEALVVEGVGKNDTGDIEFHGKSSMSGKFSLICSRKGQGSDFGWEYAGYFHTSRNAMGGRWGPRNVARANGTFFFYRT